ncbi:MAG: hypothetical protein M1839_005624 [Geoglossum umbratile]|nr:MAG: hypothetical protein M1839_005624 [Geoglossum umbratile]
MLRFAILCWLLSAMDNYVLAQQLSHSLSDASTACSTKLAPTTSQSSSVFSNPLSTSTLLPLPEATSTTGPPSHAFTGTSPISNPSSSALPNSTSLGLDLPPLEIGPEILPTPNAPTSNASAHLITLVRDAVLANYDAFSTIYCLFRGHTFFCKGPWIHGDMWNEHSLSNTLHQNTAVKSDFHCTSDLSYLAARGTERHFYGFAAENITQSLSGVADYISLYAASACSLNNTCATLYHNNTDQMFSDYRYYINSTFFDYMAKELGKNSSYSFCPKLIYSPGSMGEWLSATFDGGNEYFGLHNALFLEGVTDLLNGTEQRARAEFAHIFQNNARNFEGIFLNMVFFSDGQVNGNAKRTTDPVLDEEVYPGCTRREWIMKGQCSGVVPPREYDLNGKVKPMKDRDYEEKGNSYFQSLENRGLALRASTCHSSDTIHNELIAVEGAKGLIDLGSLAILAINLGALALEGSAIAAGGFAALAVLGFLIFCEDFNACNGVPPSLRKLGRLFVSRGASGKISAVPLAEGLAPFASNALFVGQLLNVLLSGVDDYLKAADGCCQANCNSLVCQQAGSGCVLNWSNLFGQKPASCDTE